MIHSAILTLFQVGKQFSEPVSAGSRGSTDFWLATFTFALFLATLALVVVGIFQYCAMHRQETWMRRNVLLAAQSAQAAKQSADAAEASVKASLSTMEVMQKNAWRELRARVLVVSTVRVLPGGAGSFTSEVTIKNWGRVPAYECTFWAETFLAPSPLSGASVPVPRKPSDAPVMVLPPGGETTLRTFLPAGQYNGADSQVQYGRTAVYVIGQIEYRNGFLESCTTKFFMKFGGPDYSSGRFAFCDSRNEAD